MTDTPPEDRLRAAILTAIGLRTRWTVAGEAMVNWEVIRGFVERTKATRPTTVVALWRWARDHATDPEVRALAAEILRPKVEP